MASIVVDGPINADEHLREDGSPWPFALASEESTVFSDTASGVLAHLIPGYPEVDDPEAENDPDEHDSDEALILRWQSAVLTASDVQALICADRAHEGHFDPADETEEVLTALFADKTVAVEGFDTWNHEHVPLILIATDYDPFTDRPAITGNVMWIDPSEEVAYLNSLANLGVINFYVHDEA